MIDAFLLCESNNGHSNHPLYLKFRINGSKYLKENGQKVVKKLVKITRFLQNKIEGSPQGTSSNNNPKNTPLIPQNKVSVKDPHLGS